MSCFHPLRAQRDRDTGEMRLGSFGEGDSLELPCGKCVGCRMDRARAWSIRIGHEAQMWDSNLFVTLDYAPEHLRSWSLEYSDYQGFMKRLRKRFRGQRIRFFCAGEYGSQRKRPHFHAILFNVLLPDLEEYRNGTLRSQIMESCWGRGNCVIGHVTPQSAAYVAGYTEGKAYGRAAVAAYEDLVDVTTGEVIRRRPEFCVMSRRPGIGALWYEKFSGDLFPKDHAVQDGKEWKVPRYYFERFKRDHPGIAEEVSHARYLKALEVDPLEATEERRAVREEVAVARQRTFTKRGDL